MGMLSIGALYLEYVPFFRDMQIIGALMLGAILFCFFLGLGWIYDTRMRMWSQKTQAIIERHAYYHVPMIYSETFEYPVLFAIVDTIKKILDKTGTHLSSLDSISSYLRDYFLLIPTRADIDSSIKMGKDFIKRYPFVPSEEEMDDSIPMSSRIKLGWETQMLRLTWIQGLTGLLQDVLVFGSLYVLVIFPGIPESSELVYAVLGISLPLLLILVGLGWVYDRKLKIWSVDLAVKIERNPYSYVLQPALFAFTIPFFYSFFGILYNLLKTLGLETESIEKVIAYLDEYSTFHPSRSKDLESARALRSSLGTLFQEE
jgi:hypothetical protein